MTFMKQKERLINDGSMSNPYRSRTNKSFKELTPLEKQQLEMLSRIHRMKNKSRILGDIREIGNAIMSNCAYHEKNLETREIKIKNLNVPSDEKEVLLGLSNLGFNIGNSLINDAKELINYVENNSSKCFIKTDKNDLTIKDIKKSRLADEINNL